MNKSQQNMLLAFAFIITSIFVMQLSSAAVTWVQPLINANLSATQLVNCSYTNGTDTTSPIAANTSFAFNGTGTFIAVSGSSNFVCSANACWTTIDTRTLTDSAGGSLNCTIGNQTLQANTAIRVTVDNTAPVCTAAASLVSKRDVESMTNVIATCSCADALSTVTTTTRTLTKPSTSTLTIGSSPFTITRNITTALGTYSFNCLANDSSGNINSQTAKFTVNGEDLNVISTTSSTNTQRHSNSMILIIILVAAVIAIIVIVVILSASGSKKRR
jgi:hypothetical protein